LDEATPIGGVTLFSEAIPEVAVSSGLYVGSTPSSWGDLRIYHREKVSTLTGLAFQQGKHMINSETSEQQYFCTSPYRCREDISRCSFYRWGS
jgi:hypothetical protein